jgi:hypothetical protein
MDAPGLDLETWDNLPGAEYVVCRSCEKNTLADINLQQPGRLNLEATLQSRSNNCPWTSSHSFSVMGSLRQ